MARRSGAQVAEREVNMPHKKVAAPTTPGKRISSIAGRGLKDPKSVTKKEIRSVMGEALEKRKEVVQAQHKTIKTVLKKVHADAKKSAAHRAATKSVSKRASKR